MAVDCDGIATDRPWTPKLAFYEIVADDEINLKQTSALTSKKFHVGWPLAPMDCKL